MVDKVCFTCSKPLKGRTDKKFCDDFCRNQHHNTLKGPQNNFIRKVNNALLKNRRILKKLFDESSPPHKFSKYDLMLEGFVFRYHTHKLNMSDENLMSYDFGITCSNEDCFIVREETVLNGIKENERLEIST